MVEQKPFSQRLKEIKKYGPRWLIVAGAMTGVFLGVDANRKESQPPSNRPSNTHHILHNETDPSLTDTPDRPGHSPFLILNAEPLPIGLDLTLPAVQPVPATDQDTLAEFAFAVPPQFPDLIQAEQAKAQPSVAPGEPDPGIDPQTGIVQIEADPNEIVTPLEVSQHFESIMTELEIIHNNVIQLSQPFTLEALQGGENVSGTWEDNLAGGYRYVSEGLTINIPAPDSDRAQLAITRPGFEGSGEISTTWDFVFSFNIQLGDPTIFTISYDQGQVRPTVRPEMTQMQYRLFRAVMDIIKKYLGIFIEQPTQVMS